MQGNLFGRPAPTEVTTGLLRLQAGRVGEVGSEEPAPMAAPTADATV
jgi:hypothetical protein